MGTMREEVRAYIGKRYGASPEHLWMRYPNYEVFRHGDNRKWFGLIMDVPRNKLGMKGTDPVDIIDLKLSDPLLTDVLVQQPGYLRGYHISKGNWISVLLDGSVPLSDIAPLIDESFAVTASASVKRKERQPKDWIVPANPKYYDIEHAFDREREIIWKQGSGIRKGDTVYMYVAAPVSAILYRCSVTETDIPFRFRTDGIQMRAVMRIRLEKRYSPDRFTFRLLGEDYGIRAVRGPRGVPEMLRQALEMEPAAKEK